MLFVVAEVGAAFAGVVAGDAAASALAASAWTTPCFMSLLLLLDSIAFTGNSWMVV